MTKSTFCFDIEALIVPPSKLIFLDMSFVVLRPVITASEFSLIFKVDLSSMKIIATNPEFPVLILSPSSKIEPVFKEENSFLPTFINSTRPFTFVATAILFADRVEIRKNKVKKLYLLIFNIFIQRPRTESYILDY